MEFSSPKQFLVLLFLTLSYTEVITSIHAAADNPSSSTQFIKSSCSSTTYPKLCFSSLSIHSSSIQTSPRLLATAALSVSLSSVKSASSEILKLAGNHGVSPADKAAFQDCLEELSDSVDSLRDSIGEMGKLRGSGFGVAMSNVQTWVSAALTDETTCSDGFQGIGGERAVVRGRIVKVAQLTSNALALVNRIADLHR